MKISRDQLDEIEQALWMLEHPSRRLPNEPEQLVPKLRALVDSFETMLTEFENRRSVVLQRVTLSLRVLLQFCDQSLLVPINMTPEERQALDFCKDEIRWFLRHRDEV